MTETTTKEHAATPGLDEDLVEAAARAAAEAGAKSLATIEPDQQRFTEQQVAILRQLGIEEATQGDLDLFFHYCRTTGLDPFRRQIYMIGRNTKVSEWVDDERAQNGRRKVEKWVTKYTIQTGIDGYRRNGREAAKRHGDSLAFEGPFWCGEDGEWREVWPAKTPPTAAKFTVYRNGEPFSAVVHYDEFVQTGYNGEPNSMWAKMPRNQTAKCAEAMAFRRAYPDDFSGLVYEDAAQPTVIDQEGNVEREPEKRRPAGGSGIGGVRAAREAKQKKQQPEPEVVEGEVVPDPAAPTSEEPPAARPTNVRSSEEMEALRKSARDRLNAAIFATFGELGLNSDDQREDRLVVIREIIGRDLKSSKELTDDELQQLRNSLISRKQAGTLDADVTEWLNLETMRQDAAAAADESASESTE